MFPYKVCTTWKRSVVLQVLQPKRQNIVLLRNVLIQFSMVEVWLGLGNQNCIVEVLRKEGKIVVWFKTMVTVRRWDANGDLQFQI